MEGQGGELQVDAGLPKRAVDRVLVRPAMAAPHLGLRSSEEVSSSSKRAARRKGEEVARSDREGGFRAERQVIVF